MAGSDRAFLDLVEDLATNGLRSIERMYPEMVIADEVARLPLPAPDPAFTETVERARQAIRERK